MRKALGLLALAGAAALAVATVAWATMEGHEASTDDPFLGCPIGADIFGGINYPNTEPEPWVARNPANPDNMIGAFQQDRWNDGGAKGLVASWSFNNGLKWGVTALPFSKCATPFYAATPCPIQPAPATAAPCTMPYDRASDPWVDIGPDGRAYQISISFNANDNNNAVGAAVSTDGGVTWRFGTEIVHDIDADPTFPFNDKESVTADPTVAGSAYAVWDRLALRSCGPAGAATTTPVAEDRAWRVRGAEATQQPICFEGPTVFSKTVNGGVTWSHPVPIAATAVNEQSIANQIVVDPNTGRLYDFYLHFAATGRVTIEQVFSNDKGTTWSAPQIIDDLGAVGIHDPDDPGTFARTGDIIPEPAIDPATGQLYVVWQDGRYNANGQDDVVISTSVAGGLTGTWTVPQPVNLAKDRAGFTPAIKVNALSQVGVDYYSLRHPDLGPDVWPIERYLRISSGPAVVSTTPGQRPTATLDFNTPTHVAGPFNMLMAPNAGGFFVGDYEGMAIDRDGKSFHTFFAQTNCDSTNCPAVGNSTGVLTDTKTSSPPDPFDVYSNRYFKNG